MTKARIISDLADPRALGTLKLRWLSLKISSTAKMEYAIPGVFDRPLLAWTQVLCMHLVCFNTWGISNSFGTFQTLYTATLAVSPSTISWIGGVQTSLLFFIGVFAGRATDAGFFYQTFTLGVFLQLLGIFMASLCTEYWQILLAQGVSVGFGNGFTFTSGLAVMSSYFVRDRAFAVGVGAAGSAVGGLIYPVVVDRMLYHEKIGFAWTMRVVGLIMAVTQIPCILLFKPRLPPRRAGPLVEWSAFREKPFVFFTLSWFCTFWGLYLAFFYLGTFARDRIGVDSTVNLIMVLNGVGVVGRIVPGVIGDRVTGMLNMVIPLSFAAAVLMFCWAGVTTEAGLYAFAAVYGVVAAALQSLFPAVATTMAPDMEKTGTRLGMIMSIVGVPCLTSPSVQGALIQRGGGDYLYAQLFAGVSILVGAVAAVAARVAKTGWILKARA
ncbi:MFS general substrate transporter [Aspergillus karnatakaensis]|uniref:MFS general substrate transporter n=1 Tax=Aspergillus karnatakaensis TaxID=1810916 RepID=UPI003CCCE7F0